MEEIFIQTEEQRAILESVRRFVEEEVTPRAAMLDSNPDPEDGFSWEIVEAADAFGQTLARFVCAPEVDIHGGQHIDGKSREGSMRCAAVCGY